MNTIKTISRPEVTMRWMVHNDMAQVLAVEQQVGFEGWSGQNFVTALQAIDTVAQVAEINDQIVGFVIYRISRHPKILEQQATRENRATHPRWEPAPEVPTFIQIDLLNIA